MIIFRHFSFLQIRFGDFKTLPRLIPALQTLFAADIGEMEERREKRELKNSRGSGFDLNNEQQQQTSGGTKRDQEEAATTHYVETKRLKTSWSPTHHFIESSEKKRTLTEHPELFYLKKEKVIFIWNVWFSDWICMYISCIVV